VRKGQSIKVLSEIRDLEIFDSEGVLCGIADDLEFDGQPGGPLRINALLVGPGAYRGRLPGWLTWIVWRVAGKGVVRVPWPRVAHITSRITLDRSAAELGLARVEARLRPLIARISAP
jgi:sporulation protein YlmC with PRC-barrel domain